MELWHVNQNKIFPPPPAKWGAKSSGASEKDFNEYNAWWAGAG
jgi:hypothetical protein